MRRDKTSVSQEDYLKSIWEMLEEAQTPISARLAEDLRVTPPAVTAALKRMTRDGHVRVERSGRIDLTRKGRAVAERLALQQDLKRALAKLPVMHRVVLLLVKRDGLSYAEAARKTRLNVSTVTNYVFEARARVKMLLKDREE